MIMVGKRTAKGNNKDQEINPGLFLLEASLLYLISPILNLYKG